MHIIKELMMSGANVIPLVEGGKGISISNGVTAGYWAAKGGIGTFSGVNGDTYDEKGNLLTLVYKGKTRKERHEELIQHGIKAGISQAKIARDISNGKGRIHMNVLWEMADVKRILNGVLNGAKGLIHGITCGAGMPYDLSKIAGHFKVFYYPIVSSARAFSILWQRSYKDASEWLGGVVYEDPWKAGGHNGLSRKENPQNPEDPYERVVDLRSAMNDVSLSSIPVIMAGNVWKLDEWKNFIDNPSIGKIAFQFGTRPLLTKESPIPDLWKRALLDINQGDIELHNFSPTGFFSSALRNKFIKNLQERSSRQVRFSNTISDEFSYEIKFQRNVIFIEENNAEKIKLWIKDGFTRPIKTPDNTIIFTTEEEFLTIRKDQIGCMGCLSQCKFSNWNQENELNTTGLLPDPRSFCIQKTLQEVAHAHDINIEGFSIRKTPEEIAHHIRNSENFMKNHSNIDPTINNNMHTIVRDNMQFREIITDIKSETTNDSFLLCDQVNQEKSSDICLIDNSSGLALHYTIAKNQNIHVSLEESYKYDTSQFDWNLMFSGQSAYRFKEDPFYWNGKCPHIPTISELIDRILSGH